MPNDPIRHVILLIMENRSFDHMLGGLAGVIPGLDGVDPANPHVSRDAAGQPYFQASSEITQTTSDPHHEHANVVVQLQNGNSGFVLDFAQSYPASTVQDRQQIMDYFPAGFLPGLHSPAPDFPVCQRWHAAVPRAPLAEPLLRTLGDFARAHPDAGRSYRSRGLFSTDPGYPIRPPQPGRQD